MPSQPAPFPAEHSTGHSSSDIDLTANSSTTNARQICDSPCPSVEVLKQVMLGTLDSQQQQVCICHLDHCTACQQALERLATGDCALGRKMGQLCQHVDQTVPESGSAYWPALREVEVDLAETFVPELSPLPSSLSGLGKEGAASPSGSSGKPSNFSHPSRGDLKLDFLSPPEDPAYLGRLSHFDISRVIGRGGMGVVLEAFDTHLQRPVAIKVLDPELASNETARLRFCREARAAAAITHEHVVSLHHVEKSDNGDLPFLVMQLVQGTTLEARIASEHKLPVREIVRIGMQVAAGLAAAHAEGLIHRDVKPANILLEGPSGRVKLTDFGLARCVEDVKLTQTGFVTGTPLYMAPEQALGEEIDERSDLFSLGAVMYEMATGVPPFSGTTPLAILRKITEENARPISQLNPEIPTWLVEIIGNLLKRNRTDRYSSAAEVAHILASKYQQLEHLSPLQLPTVAGDAFHETSLTCRQAEKRHARNRLLALAGGILGGMILTLSAVSFYWWQLGLTAPNPAGASANSSGANTASIGGLDGSGSPIESVPRTKPVRVYTNNAGPVWGMEITSDNKQLFTAIDDGTIRVWNRDQHRIAGTVQAFAGQVWDVSVSEDRKFFAGGGDDGSVKVFDLSTRQLHETLKAGGPVRTLQFAPKGHRLAVGTRTGQVEIWDVDTKERLLMNPGHTSGVVSVAWSKDGQFLATGGGDKTVNLWDAADGSLLLEMTGHTGGVYSVAFTADDQKIVTGGWDKKLHVWDAATGSSLGELEGHTADIWSVACSPVGGLVASAGEDRMLRLWDLDTMKPLAVLNDQSGTIYSVCFSADGKSVLTTGRDGITREWSVPRQPDQQANKPANRQAKQ
ncbi:WD40 repeat domain-containing serine/threonine protein kinase [Planctopirus hydrillae]|uniref:non-specific serine/threonine protein kinase n=1 Tax=Planctopirus hydrillae TaxID=1841610 RepID=A0A1C3EU53_9PLAN|nr:serine/threonine-protein kinase [Planctopirus hydrillae]ODA36725.1 hypothetical protein A6X21_15385 [Planctopirus hydrillae]